MPETSDTEQEINIGKSYDTCLYFEEYNKTYYYFDKNYKPIWNISI